jgi:restriction system protein
MAEITKQRQGQLVRKVFEILMHQPDGLPAHEVIARVEKELGATPFEQSTYASNPHVRRFEKIVRFSTIGPVKAGWLVKQKGQWLLTDAGRTAYEKFPDPVQFMTEAHRLYKKWKKEQPEEPEESEELVADTPGPSTTLEEAEESAWAEIEAYLGRMNPYDFQQLVAGLLRGMQYHVSWVAPTGPDKGIDVLAHKDPLGVERGRIKVQVKRRADKIPVGEVRSFLAVLGDEDVGIFVGTGGFTPDAETEARSQERRRLMLLDSKRLLDLWIEHYREIPDDERRLLPLRPVHFLVPSD